MPKKEIKTRLLITFLWLGIITLLRWQWRWDLISLWLGGLIGTFLLDIDQFLYVFLNYPQELSSLRIKRLVEERRLKDAWILLFDTRAERTKLAFHSALFQVVLFVLCFFVLTSTEGLLGSGLIMAMALQLTLGSVMALLEGREAELKERLFWLIETEISFDQQKFFVILMLLVFVGLNLLLI